MFATARRSLRRLAGGCLALRLLPRRKPSRRPRRRDPGIVRVSEVMNGEEVNEPPLQRDTAGRVDVDSVPDVIEWFLNNDQRVAVIKHPSVEEVFHWKQQPSQ